MSKKQEVLEYLQTIPKGKVTTYKNIAKIFGIHPRAVAMYMKHNKFPDKYPCYKVVAHNWNLSWYNTEKWVLEKIERLKNDWIEVSDWKIDEKYII